VAEYYDREKFTGGRRPPKKDGDWNWIVIILLFCTGMWPFALLWMGVKWLTDGKERPEDRIRRAQEKMDTAIDNALRGVSDVEETVSETVRSFTGALDGVGRPKETAPTERKTRRKGKMERRPLKVGAGSLILQILGAFILFSGVMILAALADGAFHYGTGAIPELVIGINMLLGGGAMTWKGTSLRRLARISRRYLSAVGDADSLSIDLIARRVGRSYKQAVKDLQRLIDKGAFGEDAYLDLEMGCFLRFNSEAERRRNQPVQAETGAPKEAEQGYSGVLRRIRAANDRIADEELSRKLDRLEKITGQILKEVEEHPEKRARISTFFDYYLPTTQKLLDAYADFEETGVEGENLRTAKQRIEEAMDTIVDGFANQLDALYRADAMDVATDIKVMKSMLHRDTSSAAKDFGYEEQQKRETE